MQRNERWTALLEMLARERRLDVEEAASRLDVSSATIRRDLDELADQQMLVRTRGGALPHGVSYDLPLRYKFARRAEEKHAIAEAAAAQVAPGSVVGLTGGTTTTEVARALALRNDFQQTAQNGEGPTPAVTVVTNALNIAHELAVRPHVKLVLTGGVARPQSYELVGPLAEPVLHHLALDVAILGVDSVSAESGACTNNENEAAINQLLARRAHRVMVVADGSKLGHHAFARIVPADEIDVLITDASAPDDAVKALIELGVEVIRAG